MRCCSCGRFQQNGIPCGHAMGLIFCNGNNLEPFLPPFLSTETWRVIYTLKIPTVNMSGLMPLEEEECNPPLTRVPCGRLRKVRQDKATYPASSGLHFGDMGLTSANVPGGNVTHRCGTCGEIGHNAQTCRQPHN